MATYPPHQPPAPKPDTRARSKISAGLMERARHSPRPLPFSCNQNLKTALTSHLATANSLPDATASLYPLSSPALERTPATPQAPVRPPCPVAAAHPPMQ